MPFRVKSTTETWEFLKQQLASDEPFYYSRFGDGDLSIIRGQRDMQHAHSAALAADLKAAFRIADAPKYNVGVALHEKEAGMVKGLFAPSESQEFRDWADEQTRVFRVFESAIALHYYTVFKPHEMGAFLDEFIRPKKKLFIGAASMDVKRLIGKCDYYVQVPYTDAYSTMDHWWKFVEAAVSKVDLVVLAAGMASRVINRRFYEEQTKVQSVDFGSLVDYAIGNQNRTWIRLAGTANLEVILK